MPKVPSGLFCSNPVKFPPNLEEDESEGEISLVCAKWDVLHHLVSLVQELVKIKIPHVDLGFYNFVKVVNL